jgi:hypothetical protein
MRTLAPVLLAALGAASCGSLECTEVGCTSTLAITVEHEAELARGAYRLEVVTPQQELRCSVGPETAGEASCFGFRFADLVWDASAATLTLTGPFGDAVDNPEGRPFEAVEVVVSRDGDELARRTVPVEPGEPVTPNGPDCPPTCWNATGAVRLP